MFTIAVVLVTMYACNNTSDVLSPAKTFEQVASENNVKIVNASTLKIDPRLRFKSPEELESFFKSLKNFRYTVSGVVPLSSSKARKSAEGGVSIVLNGKGGVSTNDYSDYGDDDGETGGGRKVIKDSWGMMDRNVEILWGNNGYNDNPTSNSYLTGWTMGAGFQQTSQQTYYNSNTGNFEYSVNGIQSYSLGMGPVQGTLSSVAITVSGTYNPSTGAYTMTATNQ